MNGEQYDGEWKDDKMNGKGIFKFIDGSEYKAIFEND